MVISRVQSALTHVDLDRSAFIEPTNDFSQFGFTSNSLFEACDSGDDFRSQLKGVDYKNLAALEPTEFWWLLFQRGFIHHTLFTQIKYDTERDSSPDCSRSMTLASALTTLGTNEVGRELILSLLGGIQALDLMLLSKLSILTTNPSYGFFPLVAPARLTRDAILEVIDSNDAAYLNSWWRGFSPSITLNSKDKFPLSLTKGQCESKLALMSLNVWGVPGLARDYLTRYERIGNFLRESDLDVVALQEMWDSRTTTIPAISGFPFTVTSPGFPGLTNRAGLVILSRLPIAESFFMNFKAYAGVERVVAKGALAARVLREDSSTVLIANTHLMSPPEYASNVICSTSRTERIRCEQSRELTGWINSIRRPGEDVILLGDTNAREDSEPHQILCSGVGEDLYRARLPNSPSDYGAQEADHRVGFTYDSIANSNVRGNLRARLDYCFGSFSRPDLIDLSVSRAFRSRDEQVSDHFGLRVDLKWRKAIR